MESIDEATVILIVSQSIMFLVFFLAEHFKKILRMSERGY